MKTEALEVQSLQRAIDILEAIGESKRGLSLKAIAGITGLPKSTVYRLLANLEQRGYVAVSDGAYRLGLKLLMFSHKAEQDLEIRQLARPFMAQLNEATRESVHLGTLYNNRVLYIDTIESPQPVRLVARVGGTNAVHSTALGKALLIGHADEDIRAILTAIGMEKRTERTITRVEAFLAEMAEVRRRGVAFDDEESDIGCRCVGAPIQDHTGRVIAAISVSGPASRFTREIAENEVAEQLLAATRAVSATLGLRSS